MMANTLMLCELFLVPNNTKFLALCVAFQMFGMNFTYVQMLTRMIWVTLGNEYVMERREIPKAQKERMEKVFLIIVSVNLIAPIGLGTVLVTQDINVFSIDHSSANLTWMYLFYFLNSAINIACVIGIFMCIKKTRQQLLESCGKAEMLDKSVFKHAIAMALAMIAQLLTTCAMFWLNL
jgi:hypothetical protein